MIFNKRNPDIITSPQFLPNPLIVKMKQIFHQFCDVSDPTIIKDSCTPSTQPDEGAKWISSADRNPTLNSPSKSTAQVKS